MSEAPLLLGFAVGFAPAFAHFCHMPLFVALSACDVLTFYLTHILFVRATTPFFCPKTEGTGASS